MKQKNVKFNINHERGGHTTSTAVGQLVGAVAASVLIGFMMGIGIMLASWMLPLSAEVLVP
jgi:hypothetical protein|tara:strand:- start:2207 stop:2389 length:183 start_codon:yes stop_codon:yes gene_type:complete